jgi:hypothetical protein
LGRQLGVLASCPSDTLHAKGDALACIDVLLKSHLVEFSAIANPLQTFLLLWNAALVRCELDGRTTSVLMEELSVLGRILPDQAP